MDDAQVNQEKTSEPRMRIKIKYLLGILSFLCILGDISATIKTQRWLRLLTKSNEDREVFTLAVWITIGFVGFFLLILFLIWLLLRRGYQSASVNHQSGSTRSNTQKRTQQFQQEMTISDTKLIITTPNNDQKEVNSPVLSPPKTEILIEFDVEFIKVNPSFVRMASTSEVPHEHLSSQFQLVTAASLRQNACHFDDIESQISPVTKLENDKLKKKKLFPNSRNAHKSKSERTGEVSKPSLALESGMTP